MKLMYRIKREMIFTNLKRHLFINEFFNQHFLSGDVGNVLLSSESLTVVAGVILDEDSLLKILSC